MRSAAGAQKKNGWDLYLQTQHFLKGRMLSITESVSWVWEEVLEEHEWASPLTISLKGEEKVLRELDYELDVPCVVQRGFLWFTAPARLTVKLECHDARIIKYHEVANLAIESTTVPYENM